MTSPDFELLFESSPGLLLVLSPRLEIVAASDAYLRATMTEREQVLGRGMFEVFPDNPDDAGATGESNLRSSLERVRSGLVADPMAVQKYDVRRPESEGGGFEERFWSPVNSPVLGNDGGLRYIIHKVEDVTQYVRLQQAGERERLATEALRSHAASMESEILSRSQELQDANVQLRAFTEQLALVNLELEQQAVQLRRADELKSQFLAMASHELRTPLTAIEGFTTTMLHRWEQLDESEKLQFLQIIDAQGRRLSRLVEDLLTLSSVESGKLRVEPALLDVPMEIRRMIRELGAADEVRLVAPPHATAYADRVHVDQIVLNYLTNARKYGRPPIEVSVTVKGPWLEICVSDIGDGVPEEFVPKLFETFARAVPNQSSADGTGLGLSITRALAEAQGGAAWYEPGEPGARFKASFPVRAGATAAR